VRQFVGIVAATKGATWGPGAPIFEDFERKTPGGKITKSKALVGYEGEEYIGKLTRFYWSTHGNPILRVDADARTGNRAKVPTTDGCRPMMTLPDDYAVPADLDRARYIAEAYSILADVGYSRCDDGVGFSDTIWQRFLLQFN